MKTKTFKRIVAATAALMMMSAVPMMSVPGVFAADPTYSITLNQGETNGNHKFMAYQIFDGEYYADGSNKTLLNIKWADNVNSDAIIAALYDANVSSDSVLYGKLTGISKTAPVTTAPQLAEMIKNFGKDSKEAFEFAKIVSKKIGTTGTQLSNGSNTVSKPGYYLVVDETESSNLGGDSYSARILQVLGNEVVTPKVTKPELHKKIGTDYSTGVVANTEKIGEKVNYILQTKVPDMKGYNQYYFVINDNLSEGLELDASSFEVTIDSVSDSLANNSAASDKYTKTSGYYVDTYKGTYTVSGTNYEYDNAFRLVFNNMAGLQTYAGKVITIKYSAWLGGEDKKIADKVSFDTVGANANTNTVNLIYSNDPNHEYTGTPGDNNNTPDNPNDDKPEKPYEPPMDDNPDTPGNPTPNDPTDDKPSPDNPSDKTTPETVVTYTAKLKINKIDGESANQAPLMGAGFTVYGSDGSTVIIAEKKTDAQNNGVLLFDGLKDGTYIIRETTTPTGYNTAPDYTLELIAAPTTSECTWTLTNSDNRVSDSIFVSENVVNTAAFKADIVNNKGTTLPSTGGIGTTIFYVSGGTLILGAVVVMITKKRMSLKEDK